MNKYLEGIQLIIKHGLPTIVEWSKYDTLTGAYNLRYFLEEAEKELSRVKRAERNNESYCVSLINIDIEKFGNINNSEGHPAGDESLKNVVKFLRRVCVRKTDIVARVGGDEFAILLPQTNKAGALKVVENIRQKAVDELFSPGGRSIGLDCGVAEANSKNNANISYDELDKKADEEMYKNKKGLEV